MIASDHPSHHCWREIYAQAAACQATLTKAPIRFEQFKTLLPLDQYTDLVMIGCGSSLHLAQCAAWYWTARLGRQAQVWPASELLLRAEHYLGKNSRPLVFAISRTGGTTETLLAIERLQREYQAKSIAVIGAADTPIGRAADVELAFSECYEQSVVMTHAFTVMLYGLSLLANELGDKADSDRLKIIPAKLAATLKSTEQLIRPLVENLQFTRFLFLGAGALWGAAREAALKMTEMALESSVAYQSLEFRHGPKSILDEAALVTIFPADADAPHLKILLEEILSTGATALLLGESPVSHENLQALTFGAEPERLRSITSAQVGQLMAYWRAIARGLNPDQPRHLAKTVTL